MKNVARLLLVATLSVAAIMQSVPASAVTRADWQAGRIIDDAIFANGNDMSVADVQNFLNSRVPVCDTWGTQPAYEYGSSLTHAQYAATRGWPGPPYVCLRDYVEVPKTTAGSWTPDNSYNHYDAGSKTLLPVPGGVSAAQMIVNAARQYNISSRALLIKIATESRGPLTTDDWPTQRQYTYALGAHCPDSGAGGSANCDINYSGFSIQISEAARLLRGYLDGMTQSWWPYKKPFQTNSILWNVEPSGCGAGDVFIQSKATAALYTYTPYQPNAAALNNMYSTGDGCSAYGNRNFWRTWSDWFGLPISGVAPLPVSDVWLSAREATVGQPITAAFTIRNIMGKDILLPSVGFNTTMGGKQYDFGIQTNITIPANQSREIVGVFTPTVSGSYSIQGVYQFLQGWYGSGTRSTTTVEWPAVTMGTPLSISPEFPLASETTTVQFTIKNTGRLTAYLKYVMAANLDGTTPAGYAASTVSIAPGQSYTYSATRVLGQSRQQTAWIAFQIGDSWFRLGDNKLYRGFNSPANLQLTSSVKTSPEAPVINSPTTASFKIKNSGDQPVRVANIGLGVIRRSDGARFDYTSQTNGIPGVINGGEEWTYSASRSFPTKDAYDVFLTSSYDGVNFSGDFISAAANVSKTLNVQTYLSPAKLELLTPLSARQTGGPLSHIIDLSYMVKNTGDAPTGPVNIAFYCRQNLTGYCDIPGRTISLNAGETASLNSALGYFSAGTYTFRPLKYQDGLWQDFGNTVSSTVQSTPPKSTDFTASMNFSKLTAVVGEPVTVTYTIKNNSSADLQVPIYAVAARLNGAFYDFGLQNWFFLRSGETKTFSAIFTAQTPGTYNLFPVLKTANNSWYGYGESLLVVQ